MNSSNSLGVEFFRATPVNLIITSRAGVQLSLEDTSKTKVGKEQDSLEPRKKPCLVRLYRG